MRAASIRFRCNNEDKDRLVDHDLIVSPSFRQSRGSGSIWRCEAGVSRAEPARRLGCDEKEVRRMLDPKQHSIRLPKLQQALQALGKRLMVEVCDAA